MLARLHQLHYNRNIASYYNSYSNNDSNNNRKGLNGLDFLDRSFPSFGYVYAEVCLFYKAVDALQFSPLGDA